MSGPDRIWICKHGGNWSDADGGTQDLPYIRRDPAVLATLPEVQALVDAAVKAALDDVTTLHRVIADIRAETVGHKPMLSELPQALVQWRDAAVKAEREACVAECQHIASALEYDGNDVGMRAAEHCASAIRKRGEGKV